MRVVETPAMRFIVRVDRRGADECWPWLGAIDDGGYGRFTITPQSKVGAHRFSYELFVAPIPEGLTIDHLCRNRACVNPAHLEPVTNRENTLRGFGPAGQHRRKTHCVHGHAFTPENTDRCGPDGRWRDCRECRRNRQRAKTRKQAVAA